MKSRLNQILKEAFAGGEKAVSGINPISKESDTPEIRAIIDYFKGQENVELVNIIGNGDNWQMDIRFKVEEENPQLARSMAKAQAYDIKRGLDEFIAKEKINIPITSIAGVRNVGENAETQISFIYAYKGNTRDMYEHKKVSDLLKNIFKEIK